MNQNTNVNLIPRFPFSGNLYFSQYDVGRVATINLVEDGSAYAIPSGATVKIQATKPSGLGFSVECTYNGNVVTVVSTETMTNEYGRFPCELRIESGDVLLGTTNFTFNVEKSPHPTNTVDGDSEDIINQITVALNNALSDIEDAKEEAIEEISQSGGGITEAVKVALLNCFAHTAWIDANGQTYYDALYNALYDVPAPTLTSISAVYTQSGTVYTTDTLDSLKSDLVVTAHCSDSSTSTVASADYTLSGTLTVGTSTITVSYGGKTDTFNVTVSADTTHTETTSTLVANTDWAYSAGKLSLADGTVDSSTTTWNTSEMIQIPSGTTSYAISANSAINNDYAIVWFDSEQAYIGSGISSTYSGDGTYGGGYTADDLIWNSVPVTAKYCKLSWKNTHTVTSVSFRHNIKLDENTTPVYDKVYYYTYDSSTISTYVDNDDFLPCGGMAYAQIRPVLQRSITFYDEDYIQVSQITRGTNKGNNVEIPSDAVYMKCQNTNRVATNSNITTLLGTGLIEFTETTLSEW